MRWSSLFVIICSCILPSTNGLHAQDANNPSAKRVMTPEQLANESLTKLFDDYHEQYLILFPLEATMFGDMRYNDLMPIEIAPDFIEKKKAFYEKTLKRIEEVEVARASDINKLCAEILASEMRMRLEGLAFHNERLPWNQFEGLPLTFGQLGSGAGNHPFKSVKDYDDWLHRMDAFLIWMNVAVEQFEQGMKDEYVLPAKLVEKMIEQCNDATIMTEKAEDSLFYDPIDNIPKSFSEEDKARLAAAFAKAITTRVQPAYRKMGQFLKESYLPKARATSGIGALKDGKKQYSYWVRYWTTTTLPPEDIFAMGEKEVARIRGEMEKVKEQLGFQGDLKAFFQHIRSDRSFMPFETPDQVLAAFRSIQAKIEPNVDKIFLQRPKTPFEIRRTEAFREKTASAEYMPGSEDGTRPGVFYVPIPDAKSFNVTSGMESLFLHEAIPGHHYQISLQQENQSLPKFARFLWYGAYGEGWALYCESLGKELGLYTDPKQYMGALSDEMHRAIRLVVDVGMHWKGWTREQALAYMMDNEPIAEDGAIAEIERYMSYPAQALSYKIGSLKIREWRTRFEKQLGERFNLAEFHHIILKDGGMPLNILEQRLETWAASKK
ncbi:MAG: DUF885 domain-containing protein [Pirellulales bacterium]